MPGGRLRHGKSLPLEVLGEEGVDERVDVREINRSGEGTETREMVFSEENGII